MRTRYIFLDIDGTLVDYNGKMPDSTREALLRAQAAGHKLMISTGRLYGLIYPWLLELIDFDGFVTSSGAIVKYKGERIFASVFSDNELSYFRKTVKELGGIAVYHEDTEICYEPGDRERAVDFFIDCGFEHEQYDSLFLNTRVCDMSSGHEIEKASYFGALPLGEMRRKLGGAFKIDQFSFRNMPDTCGEVTLAGVSKAAGIKILSDRLGIDRLDTVAIGDGGNDLDMVRYAGVGIAMGNSTPGLKLVADYVTDDISRDGLAKAIDLILEGRL